MPSSYSPFSSKRFIFLAWSYKCSQVRFSAIFASAKSTIYSSSFLFWFGSRSIPYVWKFPTLYPPRGAASLGGISPVPLWFACRLTWPPALLSSIQSSESVLFGHKSTTLEAIAVALPLLLIPNLCRQRHICFFKDNKAVVGGWEDHYLIHDPESSLWLRCLSIIEAYLDAHFYFFLLLQLFISPKGGPTFLGFFFILRLYTG